MRWQHFKYEVRKYYILYDIEPILVLGILCTIVGLGIYEVLK